MQMIVAWLLWFGLAALVIVVDRKLVASAAPADGPVENLDITDRSVSQYLLLQVLFGGFVIPFYLWNSRKTGAAVAVGVVLMIACSLIVGYTLTALPRAHY